MFPTDVLKNSKPADKEKSLVKHLEPESLKRETRVC